MKKILFMGTPDYATKILQSLIEAEDFDVCAVVTQPDKPVGRKQKLTPPHVKQFLLDNKINVPILQPKTLKDEEIYKNLAQFKADFIVVAAYGQILPKNILDIAPCVNLHASLLPKYRGASPIQSSILNQDTFAGVSAMLMEEGLDCGNILSLKYVDLKKDMKIDELFKELSNAAAALTLKTLRKFDSIQSLPQNDCDTSYAKKILKSDGLIDLKTMSASEIYTNFLAYDPWPGIFLQSGLKLKNISLEKSSNSTNAGTIESIEDKSVVLRCKEGSIRVGSLQAPTKKVTHANEYLKGRRIGIGDTLV